MDLEWLFLVRGDTGSYHMIGFIGWIVSYCQLDRIVSAGSHPNVGWIISYWLDWIISYRIGWIRKHWLLCTGWLLPGWYRWDGWTGWGVCGKGVGRTEVSTRRNRSATMASGTGAPLSALEDRRSMGSGSWHQLCRCCKDAEYLCRRSKIIQIECTKIRTSNLVQNSINHTYDTIVL